MRLEKLVLPSIFDTILSSFMMWNLQSYPTTVLNEILRHFRGQNILWHFLYLFSGGQNPQLQDLRPWQQYNGVGLWSTYPLFLLIWVSTLERSSSVVCIISRTSTVFMVLCRPNAVLFQISRISYLLRPAKHTQHTNRPIRRHATKCGVGRICERMWW